jgi:tetratricopeptide (TPR) repeat protein
VFAPSNAGISRTNLDKGSPGGAAGWTRPLSAPLLRLPPPLHLTASPVLVKYHRTLWTFADSSNGNQLLDTSSIHGASMNQATEQDSQLNEYIKFLKERIFFEPLSAVLHYNLGNVYARKGLNEEAISEFKQALECDPHLAQAYVNLGGLYFQKDDLDGCIDANQKATQLDPNLPMAHSNLGFAHLQKGDFLRAIEACRRAIELAPDLLQAHNNLAVAYLQMDDLAASIDASLKVLALNDRFAPAHFNLALAYRLSGNTDQARQHYATAKSLGYPADEDMEQL